MRYRFLAIMNSKPSRILVAFKAFLMIYGTQILPYRMNTKFGLASIKKEAFYKSKTRPRQIENIIRNHL